MPRICKVCRCTDAIVWLAARGGLFCGPCWRATKLAPTEDA